ncbi:hypothetical protein RUM43_005956 [Polyplax serrata]|uniref:LAGLIDADG homing endonuclease n=1 Tax=Polyplax serrata TaxID=468196 RepID=A0AAN8NX01_POLSC
MKFFSGCCLFLTRLNVSDASKITCLDKLGVLLKFNRYQESVVVYVGTAKIKIYVYQFLVSRNGRSTKLNSQFVREVTPGLAQYKNKWSRGINQLNILLDDMVEMLPKQNWVNTPVTVLFSPEVRDLGIDDRDLSEYTLFFKKHGFQTGEASNLKYLTKNKRAVLSWLSVNLVTGALGKKNKPTSTVIDLTRESCDFAYVLSETGPKPPIEDKHLCDLQVYGKPYEIYNRGAKKLGLDNIRKLIFDKETSKSSVSFKYVSSCMSSKVTTKWIYNKTTYTITGNSSPYVDFAMCERIISSVVENIPKPPSSRGRPVYGFSLLLLRLLEGRLQVGPSTNLQEIYDFARHVCLYPRVEDAFLCMDVTYFSVLLREFFDLKTTDPIEFSPYVGDIPIDWSFSASFINVPSDVWNPKEIQTESDVKLSLK